MKPASLILCCALFFLMACNNDSATDDQTKVAPSNNSSTKGRGNKKSNVEAAPINYKTLSAAYCKCAEKSVSISDKLKKLMDDKETAAFDALLPEANKAFKEAMECCRDAKFQQTTGSVDQKKLFKPLKAICPELPKQLMFKMVTELE